MQIPKIAAYMPEQINGVETRNDLYCKRRHVMCLISPIRRFGFRMMVVSPHIRLPNLPNIKAVLHLNLEITTITWLADRLNNTSVDYALLCQMSLEPDPPRNDL